MRSVEDHRARAVRHLAPLGAVEVELVDAAGCVLAGDVTASGPLPAFDVSAMDGYAVRGVDVTEPGRYLPVVADLPAGVASAAPLAAGTAVRIMTGAPVPPGADAVVPVEATDGWAQAGGRVRIDRAPRPGEHVRGRGESVTAGEVLVRAGTLLGPRQVSLLAATGHGHVGVHARPRVAVVSTGDELVAAGCAAGFGQVHDANTPALITAARAAGAVVTHVDRLRDDPGAVLDRLRRAAAAADVVVTSGGVSAGAYDVVKEVLSGGAGAEMEFVKVAMQPGMPQGLGRLDDVPVFTLPGNPVSAWLSFEMFVRPALAVLRGLPPGHPQAGLPSVRARAAVAWTSPKGKRQFSRAVIEASEVPGDLPSVAPVGGPGSHLVRDLAVATVLAVVPEDVERVSPGDELECLLLEAWP